MVAVQAYQWGENAAASTTATPNQVRKLTMSLSAGRPPKPAGEKRKQLHLSLYAEDIERLDQLTDNRSEFVRKLIEDAWHKQADGDIKLEVTVPGSIVREVVEATEAYLSPQEALVIHKLLRRLAREVSEERAAEITG